MQPPTRMTQARSHTWMSPWTDHVNVRTSALVDHRSLSLWREGANGCILADRESQVDTSVEVATWRRRDNVANGETARSRTRCRCTYNARTQHTTVIVYKPLKRLVRKRKEREEERSLVSSRQTYNQSKIAGGMHLVSLNNKKASRNDGTYQRINVNQERNAVTS